MPKKRPPDDVEYDYSYDDVSYDEVSYEVDEEFQPTKRRKKQDSLTAHRQQLQADGYDMRPVLPATQSLTNSFWGQAWCRNLLSYQDYEHRLPPGRTYLRQGRVLDLNIEAGLLSAWVSGKELYEVSIRIDPLSDEHWRDFQAALGTRIEDLAELLSGELPEKVLAMLVDPELGLFPCPDEIHFSCTCLDWADMCKHVASTLYAFGVRLNEQPELFFRLRGVDPEELIRHSEQALLTQLNPKSLDFDSAALEELFDIELFLGEDQSASLESN